MNKTRPKQMILRMSEKEKEIIQKKIEKSKLKQNEYLLKCALGKDIKVIEGLTEIMKEIKRIGVNVNQIAKSSNQGKNISSNTLENIQGELSEVWQLLKQLIQKQV